MTPQELEAIRARDAMLRGTWGYDAVVDRRTLLREVERLRGCCQNFLALPWTQFPHSLHLNKTERQVIADTRAALSGEPGEGEKT